MKKLIAILVLVVTLGGLTIVFPFLLGGWQLVGWVWVAFVAIMAAAGLCYWATEELSKG